MANADEELEQIIGQLSTLAATEDKPPAMVVVAPDQGESILGNRGGFLHLAVSALKAARGEEQKFKNAEWVCHEDIDWQIAGLKPDPLAHVYRPEKRTRFQRLRGEVFGGVLLLAVFGFLVTGWITFWNWVTRMFHW